MTTLITLVIPIGGDAGPFNLFSDIDGYTVPFETGVSAAVLIAGYTTSLVPNGTTIIRVVSVGICTNHIDIQVNLIPTTTTTSSSSSSTSTSTSTSTSSTSSTTSTSSSSTTTTTVAPVACSTYTVNPVQGFIHLVEYFPCDSIVSEIIEVGPSDPPTIICAISPLISDSHPANTILGGECFAPTTTTTTTPPPITYRCIRLDGCDGFGYRDVVYNALYETVGQVFQYYIYTAPAILHCGTVINNNIISTADSAITNVTPVDLCGNVILCEVPNPG